MFKENETNKILRRMKKRMSEIRQWGEEQEEKGPNSLMMTNTRNEMERKHTPSRKGERKELNKVKREEDKGGGSYVLSKERR